MARLESRSITCNPEEENSTIDRYERFGWTLKSSQEVYNKDSHLEGQYNVTETTNYVKLVFERDKDMPYYDQITDLEFRYNSIRAKYPSRAGKNLTMIFGLIFSIIGSILFLISISAKGYGIGSAIVFLLIGIPLFVLSIILRKKYNATFLAASMSVENQKAQIMNELSKYV